MTGYPKNKEEVIDLQDALEANDILQKAKMKAEEHLSHDIELSKAAKEIRELAMNPNLNEKQFSAILEDLHSKETNRYSADEDRRYDFGTIVHRAIIGV